MIRDIIDTFEWNQLSQPVYGNNTSIGNAGTYFAEDLRNNNYQHPEVFFNGTSAQFNSFNKKNEAWRQINTAFGLGGTFGVGSCAVFVPSLSPRGTLAAGNTATKIVLNTALPLALTENSASNRGDGMGFIIRIAGLVSGKVEERRVIANTAGTTPTILLNEPLSFVPAAGDIYEFLSGSYLALNTGALPLHQFRRYDLLTGNITSLSTTNLIATVPATANNLIAIDEGYVSHDRNVSEGYLVGTGTYDLSNLLTGGIKKCLIATASAGSTITGQATGGDSNVLANQYRNFQIRVVEDTVNPTAINQRRRIASHTGGTSPVYTLNSNWTVTPSANAKYVIENWSENVILMAGGTSTVYNYTHSNLTGGTADTWNTTQWTAKGNTLQANGSYCFHAFGISADEINSAKSSNVFVLRNNATANYDVLDLAGGVNGAWTSGLAFPIAASNYEQISIADLQTMAYNPHTQSGKYLYFFPTTGVVTNLNQRPANRIDLISRKPEKIAGMRAVSGTSTTILGMNMGFISLLHNENNKLAFWNCNKPCAGNEFWQLPLTR